MYEFASVVSDPAELREIMGHPHEVVLRKQMNALDKHCTAFIDRCPFLLIASSDGEGHFDISPKGDPAGFVKVLDEHTLLIPERLGNKRADTYTNVLKNNAVGLIFLIPGKKETLRISGSARIIKDQNLLNEMACNGKVPQFALAVDVQEAFFHCAKCMIRSELWKPEKWPSLEGLPSLAETMVDGGNLKIPRKLMSAIVSTDQKFRLY